MDQFPQQRSNGSNPKNPMEKDSIFYSFTPLTAVAALLRNCVCLRGTVAYSVRGLVGIGKAAGMVIRKWGKSWVKSGRPWFLRGS